MHYMYNRYVSTSDLYKSIAVEILKLANESIKKKGKFTIALSGGSTPKKLYKLLATEEYQEKFPWNDTYVFWSDERFVHYNDPKSNYGMVKDVLLNHVPISKENIFRVLVSKHNAKHAAAEYELTIKQVLGDQKSLDLVLLGLGLDGHTASLFPNSSALKEQKLWVVNVVPKKAVPLLERVSFTLPIINNASNVFFLVSGRDKRGIVSEIIKSYQKKGAKKYPAALVNPHGELKWFTDFELEK